MQMQLKLSAVSMIDSPIIIDMLREIGPGENGFQNGGYDTPLERFSDYLQYRVNMAKGVGLEPNYVSMTTYWLFADAHPVGISKLRHRLNEALLRTGGHIGYCIRPTERGRGYGNQILRLTLLEAREMSIDRVLITCDEENIASRKVIEWNGGLVEDMVDGKCRYWIELK